MFSIFKKNEIIETYNSAKGKKKDLEIKNKVAVSEGTCARERNLHAHTLCNTHVNRKSKPEFKLLIKEDRL